MMSGLLEEAERAINSIGTSSSPLVITDRFDEAVRNQNRVNLIGVPAHRRHRTAVLKNSARRLPASPSLSLIISQRNNPMLKVFRVFISETQGFHHDIEAETAYAAKQKVRASFKCDEGSEDIQPIEDSSSYTGYQVDDAIEIAREDSDLT